MRGPLSDSASRRAAWNRTLRSAAADCGSDTGWPARQQGRHGVREHRTSHQAAGGRRRIQQWWSYRIHTAGAPAEDRRRSCGGFGGLSLRPAGQAHPAEQRHTPVRRGPGDAISILLFSRRYVTFLTAFQIEPFHSSDPTFSSRSDLWYVLRTYTTNVPTL